MAAETGTPDIVVLSANFWDIARWNRHHASVLSNDTAGQAAFQLQLVLWQQHFVKLLQIMEVTSECWFAADCFNC